MNPVSKPDLNNMNKFINDFYKKMRRKIIKKHTLNTQYTDKILIGLLDSARELKDGILLSMSNELVSPTGVMFRSFIEHYLKLLFILTKLGEDKSDKIGKEYCVYCTCDELSNYQKFTELVNELTKKDIIPDYDKLVDSFFEAQGLSDQDKKSKTEINKIIAKFTHKRIIKFFSEQHDEFFNNQIRTLIPVLYIYQDFSSFIHAGPKAILYDHRIDQKALIDCNVIALFCGMFLAVLIRYRKMCYTGYLLARIKPLLNYIDNYDMKLRR